MSRRSGTAAEELALRHLQNQGLKLIERNYRCRQGEIDLVLHQHDTLVFVEVRYRRNTAFGSAVETVDMGKRSRLLATARHYLQRHPQCRNMPCRFDVVGIEGDQGKIDWLKNAFGE